MFDERYVFHVHTKRCGHAEDVEDEEYVKRAVELGAESIYFTDHAPFPGDPFLNRMKYEELSEYITTLKNLRKRYEGIIDLKIGLEIEYLPSFHAYYDELNDLEDIDILILGQHHSEICPGIYSFEIEDKSDEWKHLMDGQIVGTETGIFDVVAHPDRLFKREKQWTQEMRRLSEDFIDTAAGKGISLEKNLASMRHKGQYWDEFWELVPVDYPIITGCDAHVVEDIQVIS